VAALEKEWISKFGPPTKKDGDLRYWGCAAKNRVADVDVYNDCVVLEINPFLLEVRAMDDRIKVAWSKEYQAKVAAAKQ
ncbi:MAG: hypothetical protein KF868_20415, partial [Acidobacteria bacterium]|nr:hypothetical protein [Acidobacteriota bacterium]